MDRIFEANHKKVINASETKLIKLELDKLVVAEKLSKSVKPTHTFDEMFELACQFLATPYRLWESGHLTLQRTVLRLAFSERIAYSRNEGLRIPKTTLPFKVSGAAHAVESKVAERKELAAIKKVKGLYWLTAICGFIEPIEDFVKDG